MNFSIRTFPAGPAVCVLCKRGLDLAGSGTIPEPGPQACDSKGRPVCRPCLKKEDEALFVALVQARAAHDQRESEARYQAARERARAASKAREGYEKEARPQAKVEAGLLLEDARAAVAVHPKHLAARRRVVLAARSLAAARRDEYEAAEALRAVSTEPAPGLIEDAGRAHEIVRLTREAEAALTKAKTRGQDAEAGLKAAREHLAQIDEALLREMLAEAYEAPMEETQ